MKNNEPVLIINGLTANYDEYTVLRDVDLTLEKGRIVCIVGESGSGKTSLIRAVTGYEGLSIMEGTIKVEGADVTHITGSEKRKLLGKTLGYIPQNPAGSYNPIRQYEPQIRELLASHNIKYDRKEVTEAFARMGLEHADKLLRSRPYELSGGMNQRAAIAAAMLLEPSTLLCDEPMSALDVTTANLVTGEFLRLNRERGTTILMVTHNLGLANIIADNIAIMHEGKIVEFGCAKQIIEDPQDNYTKKLIGDVPKLKIQ